MFVLVAMHVYLILFVLVACVGVGLLYRNPLRSVPGPFLARFTDLWYLFKVRRGDFQIENRRLHAAYGPIVRYGPNRYSFDHPDAIKAIYAPGAGLAKSAWYDTWAHPGQWTLFADRSVKRHAENKRAYQSAYSMSSLVQYESYVDECADLFVRRLKERSGGEDIELEHWLQCFAFDVIGKITYAERLGFLDTMEDVGGVMAALDSHIVYASLAGIYSRLHPYLVPLRNFWAGSKGSGRSFIVDFTKRSMAAHDTSVAKAEIAGTEAECMLSKFVAKSAASPDTFTPFHILAGCVSNMVAGSDTTSLSLSAIIYYLHRNEKSLIKLRAEIADFQERGQLSVVPAFQEAQQMPYLQAVIKEALRMHPAAGLPIERVVPPGGLDICERFFPGGTIVGINPWVEHRNPQIWGPDANEFRPERWLTDDASGLAVMNRHNMTFGVGSRTCIGKNISLLEITKLLPRLIRDFEFQLADPSNPWRIESYWFVRPKGFKVALRQREATL